MSLAPTNHIMWKNRRYLNVSMTLMALRYLGSYLMSVKVCDFSTCLMWLKALVVCCPKWQVRIWFDLRPEWTPSWSSISRPFPPLAIFGAGDFPIPTPFFSPHWPWITRGFSGFLRKSWKIKRIIEKKSTGSSTAILSRLTVQRKSHRGTQCKYPFHTNSNTHSMSLFVFDAVFVHQ